MVEKRDEESREIVEIYHRFSDKQTKKSTWNTMQTFNIKVKELQKRRWSRWSDIGLNFLGVKFRENSKKNRQAVQAPQH